MARPSASPDRPHDSSSRYRDRHDDHYESDRRRYRDGHRRSARDDRHDDRDRRRDQDDRRDGRYRSGRDRSREPDREGQHRDDCDKYGGGRTGPSRRSASPSGRGSRARSRSSSKREGSAEDKAKPNFKPSGLLAAATKTVRHVDGTSTVLKYHEPPEARKPTVGWRLYAFKGTQQVDVLHIHRQSAYLIGRDRAIADLAIENPSCSKQHAVIQYRQVHEKNELGDVKNVVKPFIIDLESTNGTFVNGEQIPESRYYELRLQDVLKFGESDREYVLLHDEAA